MQRLTRSLSSSLVALTIVIAACSNVPITGRTQFNLVPDALVLSTSYQQYNEFLSENKVSENRAQTAMVKDVGSRIQSAVTRYFTEQNQLGTLEGYAWDFNLVEDTSINAWCMPGGKVVIYTGILPVTRNEAGLAVVMGHEIAHAIAKHGNERLTQQLAVNLGGIALSEALSSKSEQTQQIWGAVYGVGSQVGFLLPYSRTHETEADRLGLIFMAMAGYDPNEAIPFWQRMSAAGGGSTPEFLSTHPSDATRIKNLQSFLPEAMSYYRR